VGDVGGSAGAGGAQCERESDGRKRTRRAHDAGVYQVAQPGEGYLSRERFFLIEKACAGINFMIGCRSCAVLAL
jgi:hypothetical protein